ncbi:MAG: outer membrane beta-barrel family protein, partial [Muribaculaceae bacterium]|nr:outer membrane beta-barrel family protein [Muribaculaceae bacterium]
NEWIANQLFDYDSNFREDIVAAYTTFNGQSGRWRFKAGLRGEYYNTAGVKLGLSKFDLFPNANISFNLNDRGDYTVALGYYRHIRRPSFWSLNPTVRQVSDYSYSVGNPDLSSSHVDAFSLDFVLAGKYTIAAGYSETSNPIRQMFISNPEYPERMYLTWDNMGKDRNCFIHGDGLINITKWWTLYASLTYTVTSQKIDKNSDFDTFGYLQAVASTTFVLPHSFNITLNGFYQTKMKVGNIDIYPILNINPTIQKRFGKHWSLSLGVENMLQRKSKIRAVSSGYNRLTSSKQYMAIKLGVTYNFNSGKGFRAPRIEKNNDGSRLKKE